MKRARLDLSIEIPLLALFALLASAFLTACQFYQAKDSAESIQVTERTVSYRMLADHVIRSRCLRCHANEFDSYDAIRNQIASIEYRALTARDMPPNAPLSPSESKILKAWIDAGMPLNAGDHASPRSAPPALEPTYASIRDQIFKPRCSKCHAAGEDHDDIDIFDHAKLTSAKGWVVPGDPSQSELFADLLKPGKGRMPPTKTGPPLSSEEIEVIRTWIINGAQE